eukprot:TRINITY_DN2904_c0_g1_i7.p2 TRINITY_DN2904_c0_g1~~TRINITY_DN2904_c0_g1_i7.p2  ORF type:complete len:134 (+),score=15.24 TRINITY_DN2904_c0_g1_i7:696-1097(+)
MHPPSVYPSTVRMNPGNKDNKVREFCLFGTNNGSIGIVHNLDEVSYRRLETLQRALINLLTTRAGTNPREYRMGRAIIRRKSAQMRTTIDGDIIWRFLELNIRVQTAISKQIHTTREVLLRDLFEIEQRTALF